MLTTEKTHSHNFDHSKYHHRRTAESFQNILYSNTNTMARFTFVDYDDDSSVDSVAPSDGSCSLEYSIDGDGFITDAYFSSDDDTVASGESSIDDSLLDNEGDKNECSNEVDVTAVSPPPVIAIAVVTIAAVGIAGTVDIVPPRRSSRSRRKPERFADEYAKYYC